MVRSISLTLFSALNLLKQSLPTVSSNQIGGPMSPSPPDPKDATAPFNDRNADVILRSGDCVDFRVYRVVLSLASPVFNSMFTLPTPSASSISTSHDDDDHRDGLAIIALSEDAVTLDHILRACYPGAGPNIDNLDTLFHILVASEKYEIEALRTVAGLILMLHVEKSPVETYALSCRFGYPDIIPLAARAALAIKFDTLIESAPGALRPMDNVQFQHLLRYHRKCGEVANRVAKTRSWLEHTNWLVDIKRDGTCDTCQEQRKQYDPELATENKTEYWAPSSVWNYLEQAAYVMRERPVASVVFEAGILPDNPVKRCPRCGMFRMAGLDRLARRFHDVVAEAVGKVVSVSARCALSISVCAHPMSTSTFVDPSNLVMNCAHTKLVYIFP